MSVLVAAETSGIVTILHGGVLPIAKIDLSKVLQTKEAICCDKIDLNDDCSEVVVMGKEARG